MKGEQEITEELKRKAIHEMLDLVLDINGVQISSQELTGAHPTAFFGVRGHVGKVGAEIYPRGWGSELASDEKISVESTMTGYVYEDEYTLYEAVRKLKKIKAILIKEED